MSIRRHTIYNLSGQLIPFAVTLATLPPFLGLIGENRYGVMAIAWLLLGYFGVFDFGMSRATAQRVAQLHRASTDERSCIVWTSLIAVVTLGLVGGLLLWGIGQLIFSQLSLESEALRAELQSALPWLSLALPITFSVSVLSGALQGREQFFSLNVVQLIISSLIQLLPLAVAVAGYVALEWLIPATLAPRMLGLILFLGLCRRHVPLIAPIRFDFARLRSLLGYGGWITLSAIIGPLLAVADRLIIGKVIGTSAVTFYVIPHGLVSRGVVLAGSLSSAIFPRFSMLTVSERDDLMRSALRALAFVVTPIVFMAMWFVDPFFKVWLGSDVAHRSVPVAEILLLGLWLNSLAYVPHTRLQGEGNPKIVGLIHLAELVPYILLLWTLLSVWGIVGAATAWTIRVAVDAVLLLVLSRTAVKTYVQLLMPFAILVTSMIVVLLLPSSSTLRWVVCTALFIMTTIWAAREVPDAFWANRPVQSSCSKP